ncbi:MAG: VCBS repeat-containing protein, partial [Bacteroidales bacterium]|nr:VCBS repeat-containing protein [Bacteroidales bacterium]
MPAVKVANYAFENEGDLNFVKRNQEWFDHTPSYSYGAAFADLDGDGDLDYVVNNLNDEHFLSRGYTSSVDPVVHFGLSAYVMVDSIRVTWQAGDHISHLRNIEANQLVEIDERDAIPSHMDSQSQEDTEYPFSRLEGVISYDHQQDDFIDFFYSQSIIPHKVSQIGPCMQKGDLNNDGLEDIIVGATNTLPTRVFLRDSNRFVETEIEGLSTRKG